jgi:hypothetical protein
MFDHTSVRSPVVRQKFPPTFSPHFQRRTANAQDVADQDFPVVEPDLDGDGSLLARVVVEAHHREEAGGLALEVDDELVDRPRPDAVCIRHAAEDVAGEDRRQRATVSASAGGGPARGGPHGVVMAL